METGLGEWTDEECLTFFTKFFDRVEVGTDMVENEHGFFTHETMMIRCGEKLIMSTPTPLDWPLEPVVAPELDLDNKRTLN